MMKLEFKKLLRDKDWKFLIFVVLGGFLYYAMAYNDLPESTGIGLFNTMSHEQLLASIAAFPAFLFLYLLYRIAHQQEHFSTWKCELAFRKDQKMHLLRSMGVLLAFQFIPLGIGEALYYALTQSFQSMFFRFMLTMELTYLISYFYYTFLVKSGILSQGLNSSVVNPLRSLTPAFLVCCIFNMGDWMDVLSVALMPMLVTVFLLYGALLYNCNYWMRVKLHRELVLDKLFAGSKNPRKEEAKLQQKQQLDTVLQFIFTHLPFHSPAYWRFVAVLEVSVKQKGYPLGLMFVAIMLYASTKSLLFLGAALLCLGYFIVFYQRQKQMMKKVSIPASH